MKFLKNISVNDRRALAILFAFAVILFLYWALQASFLYRSQAEVAFRESRLFLMGLYSHGRSIRALETSTKSNAKSGADQTLLSLASSSAKGRGLSFKRFQPDGDDLLELWLEEVNFNVLVWWLSEMESTENIRVHQISVDRAKQDGFVNARITLAR